MNQEERDLAKRAKIKQRAQKERERMNKLAFDSLRKANSAGSGCASFDKDVKETHGQW